MLQIKDVSKQYKTGTLVQQALDHVSLNLRDNEFVAILGPSGSGKTTLLNIIGGLDRYDKGDLIINGVSTKKYKDRDWDSYRNHTIGFVFQSYNLIPHQTVLANVELALTISGISRSERKRRAMEALEKVGLGNQMHKRPSQMSGGQMQRVAIARALVNDPDILLADEPTGALDSETSIQVMDLLQEVAKDRLVVMVTHNPELAEQYATRIVRLKDGVIRSDSNPFEVKEEKAVHKSFGKASMSFLTALGLSFNNLKTKLARTLLVAMAGSIGITGIAMILSLSNGVDEYIQDVEENTLSEYPLEIGSSSFDLSSFMGGKPQEIQSDAEVVEWKTVSNMLTKITANDLSSLQAYFESGESSIDQYARALEYSYSVVPEIYRVEGNTYFKSNPDSTFSDLGFSGMTSYMSSQFSTNSFMALPTEPELYRDQYDVKAGRWPENSHELVVVLSEKGRIADLTLYALGMKDHKELEKMISDYMAGEESDLEDTIGEYSYEDFLGLEFKLVHSCDYYQYDTDYHVWTSKAEDKTYVRELLKKGEDLTIVGVVQPKEDTTIAMLSAGVYYPEELVGELVDYAGKSQIVKSQLAKPNTDVITNTAFGERTDGSFDMMDLFSVDEDALSKAIQFDLSGLNLNFSGLDLSNMDFGNMDFTGVELPNINLPELLSKLKININGQTLATLFQELLADYINSQKGNPSTDITKLPAAMGDYLKTPEAQEIFKNTLQKILAHVDVRPIIQAALENTVTEVMNGYEAYANANGITDLSGLPAYLASNEVRQILARQAEELQGSLSSIEIPSSVLLELGQQLSSGYEAYAAANGLPEFEKIQAGFTQWIESDSVRDRILAAAADAVDTSEVENLLQDLMAGASDQISALMTSLMEQVSEQVAAALTDSMAQAAGSLQNALSIDPEAFAKAFKVTMTETELQELMTVMMTQTVTSLDANLEKMGYADMSKPSAIKIYPKDFDAKEEIKKILDDYNLRMEDSGQEEKVIAYTDLVGTLMSSVTDIINAISYVLVAFVAISLVVSSIMIGVITYISVLERKKEIGILRAMGASKHNISQVFNAETFIIGLLAGLIGVGGTELILIPVNLLLHHLTGMNNISAILPIGAALILIGLSVLLTMLGGLLPSKKAAKSDPVTALRTE